MFVVTGPSDVKELKDLLPNFPSGAEDDVLDLATSGINFEDVATKADKYKIL